MLYRFKLLLSNLSYRPVTSIVFTGFYRSVWVQVRNLLDFLKPVEKPVITTSRFCSVYNQLCIVRLIQLRKLKCRYIWFQTKSIDVKGCQLCTLCVWIHIYVKLYTIPYYLCNTTYYIVLVHGMLLRSQLSLQVYFQLILTQTYTLDFSPRISRTKYWTHSQSNFFFIF